METIWIQGPGQRRPGHRPCSFPAARSFHSRL